VLSVTVHDAGGAATSGSVGGVSSHTPLFLGDALAPAPAASALTSSSSWLTLIELLFLDEILLAFGF
jgi:hypothetical protein